MNSDFLVTLLQFIGALVALIIIHELGHFFAAKLFKVEVEEFGIGFPPRIATLFEAGGTKFTLNAIPLGGFVRPKGENDPTVPGGFAAASPWVRLVVLSAGPIANLLVGVLLYAFVIQRVGMPDQTKVRIIDVPENSPAAEANLMSGDLILKVNDTIIDGTDAMQRAIDANLGKPVTLLIQRGEETMEVSLTPRLDPPEGQGPIGIVMGNPTRPVSVIQSLPAGVVAVYYHVVALIELPVQMIQGNVSPEQGRLVGIKGMFDIYQEVTQDEPTPGTPAGIDVPLFFAQITISLGLLNLFPFPALDGGRILFTLPEIIIRRRVPPEYENWINLIGFGILLMLLIYVNLQDFISPAPIP